MFRGSVPVNLDEKGRIAIPSRFREKVQESCDSKLVVTVAVNERGIAMTDCLWIYPLPAWEELEITIKNLPSFKKKSAKLKRFLVTSAFDCDMDNQGRVLIPEKLRSFANLGKKLVVAGHFDRLELWNEETWNINEAEFKEDDGDDSEEDMKFLEGLSF